MDLAGHEFEPDVMKRSYARKALAKLVDGNEWVHMLICRRLPNITNAFTVEVFTA
jgi:hypothetical protein